MLMYTTRSDMNVHTHNYAVWLRRSGGSGCELGADGATAMAASLAALTALTALNIR